MGPHHLLLLLALAATPKAPALARPVPTTPLEVTAAGIVVVGTVAGAGRDRYRLTPDQKGTVLISIDPIYGPAPRAMLRNAQGRGIRRADRRGKLWARPAPGTELVVELSAPRRDVTSVYQLSVAFDVDRPRQLRQTRRPARPRDVVRVPASDVRAVDRVLVGGQPASYTIHGSDVLVAIPAWVRSGPIELHFEDRAPEQLALELVGLEPPREDLDTGACALVQGVAPPGCLRLNIEPAVGSQWLVAIARLLDADIAKHAVKTGVVELKLRLPASQSYALEQLKAMRGVRRAYALGVTP